MAAHRHPRPARPLDLSVKEFAVLEAPSGPTPRAPEPILDAAWQWEDLLRKAFGPRF